MTLTVNKNVPALHAYRHLAVNDHRTTASLERLSSGFRIVRAADDPSGLTISEGLRSQVGGLKVAVRNAQDGISVIQTADGALAEAQSILQRMRDLSVAAGNTAALTDDARAVMQTEMASLGQELDRIAESTTWNGTKLLDGGFDRNFQLGADSDDALRVRLATGVNRAGLGLTGVDIGASGGTYRFSPTPGAPGPGRVAVYTEAVDTNSSAVLHFADPDGISFSGPGAADAFLGLDGVIGFGGRTFDLSSVEYDLGADSDSSGAVDADDLLAQLNDAAKAAFGLTADPFLTGSGRLAFFVSAGEPAYSAILPVTAGASADEIARATPTFGPGGSGASIRSIDAAITSVSSTRAVLGALQNRFESSSRSLGVSLENMTASESRIRDADMAQEMVGFTRNQILTQAGTAMLGQANHESRGLMKLLG